MKSLDPEEESRLRELEVQMSEEDPRLAERLRTMRPFALARVHQSVVGNWRTKYLALVGCLLLAIGVTLPEAYSRFFGTVLCSWALVRAYNSRKKRRAVRG